MLSFNQVVFGESIDFSYKIGYNDNKFKSCFIILDTYGLF